MRRNFTPRWTVQSVLFAFVITAGIYLLLPYLETLSSPPEKSTSVRSVQSVKLPPPPPTPPKRAIEKKTATQTETPRPQLETVRRKLAPLKAAMDLNMALGDIGGDFSVDFDVSSPTLKKQIEALVFEIKDLDEPPHPLARLSPIYPRKALNRKIEGVVLVEFIVTESGSPEYIKIISSKPGDIFSNAAIRAIERWRFAPGKKNGKEVATRVRQKVEFKLR